MAHSCHWFAMCEPDISRPLSADLSGGLGAVRFFALFSRVFDLFLLVL
jgi:hypothetical protein